MTVFKLDGKRHAVEPEDCCIIDGPGEWTSADDPTQIRILLTGETLTLLFDQLVPGEMITVVHHGGPTIFFRPYFAPSEDENVVKTPEFVR